MGKASFALLILSGGISACSGDSLPEVAISPDSGFDSSVSDLDAAGDADGRDSPMDVSETSVDAEAGLARVVLGIRANGRASYEGEAAESAELEGLVQGLSSGARGFVEDGAWATLSPVSSGFSEPILEKLSQRAALFRGNGRELYLQLKVIDGALDGRPADLHEVSWGSYGLLDLSKALIDRIFEKTGTELRYLSLGSEVDLYLSSHGDEAQAITLYFGELTKYVVAHGDAPPGLRVGVGLSSTGFLLENPPQWLSDIPSMGKVVMLSHHPLNEAGMAVPVLSVSEEMQALVTRAKGRPIVLERIGYPSSGLIGGGEDSQGKYLEGIFKYVGEHREAFAFVGIHALHDPSPNDCVHFAAMQGKAESSERYAYECSTGLRRRDDAAKPSFQVFLQGASLFLDP